MDSSSEIIIIGMILLFAFLFSVFVVKPIILALIRWITFRKIHNDETSNKQNDKDDLTHDKVIDLSQKLFSELDEIDKESRDDVEKIEKIVDYQEKRKKK